MPLHQPDKKNERKDGKGEKERPTVRPKDNGTDDGADKKYEAQQADIINPFPCFLQFYFRSLNDLLVCCDDIVQFFHNYK